MSISGLAFELAAEAAARAAALASQQLAPPPATPPASPPALAYKYSIDLDGFGFIADTMTLGSVSVEVPSADTWVVEWNESAKRPQPQLVSLASCTPQFSDVSFGVKKVNNKIAFFRWLQDVVDGRWDDVPRNGTVRFFDAAGSPTADWWNFEGAWPSKWAFGTSGGGKSAVKYESITLKVNRFWVDTGRP